MNPIFEMPQRVTQEHIDDLGHVNNVVYLSWAQDVANKHWSLLKADYDTSDFVWVVLRHEIDYRGQAVLGDQIIVKTWVGETAGIKSVRYIEFFKASKSIVKIKTTWCLVDSKSLRPKRINGDVLNILQIHQ